MDKECYKDIEKIKTIGSTYMAAVGLVPTVGTKVTCQVSLLFCCSCTFGIFKEGHGTMLFPPSGQKVSL